MSSGCLAEIGDGEGDAGDIAVLRGDLVPGQLADGTGGLQAIVPEPGMGVAVELYSDDGSISTLRFETLPNEEVWQLEPDHEDEVAVFAGSPAPCQDRAFNLQPWRWAEVFRWRFNAGSTPSYLGKDAVEGALRRATSNITRSRNSCGMTDQVGARHRYEGRVARGVNIARNGSCRSPDGHNVVGFGDLPAGTLGVACTWYFLDGSAAEGDVRLNKADHRWYVNKPSSCSGRFSIEAVMTHERGHTFGLGHVAESSHGRLTMSTRIPPCSNQERTLGRGDVRGLRNLY